MNWTIKVIQPSLRSRTYRIMEGIKPIASCTREKHARLIVDLHADNERLRLIETAVRAFVKDPTLIELLMEKLGYVEEGVLS